MPFVGESFTARDAHRGEDSPAADDSGLARREAHFFNRLQTVVMENVAMDHANRLYALDGTRRYESIVPSLSLALQNPDFSPDLAYYSVGTNAIPRLHTDGQ